jgi:tRNA(Ile)-lysidine synthase
VYSLAQRVLEFVRRQELLRSGDRVGVAVSGGADSVALLRLLLELRGELGAVLSVVHLNHQLRGAESDADERFVSDLARAHELPSHLERSDVAALAKERHLSVEAAAREARYGYFHRLIAQGLVGKIATGHTLDDQAETVVLRLVRGAGIKGLAGIYPALRENRLSAGIERQASGVRVQEPIVVRPLLEIARKELEAYLTEIHQDWREDTSNRDMRFVRNRVRHGILPRMEEHLNPGVRHVLAETAEIARAEEEYWAARIAGLLPEILKPQPARKRERSAGGSLLRDRLLREPLAVQRRLVRAAGETLGLHLEFAHVEEILAVARGHGESARSCNLPDDRRATRNGNEVRLQPLSTQAQADYEHRFRIPGRVGIPEIASSFEATPLAQVPAKAGYNREHLYAPQSLAKELVVRNWRPGDRFWPAHSKSPKKIKELLQERKVARDERGLWPVVVSGEEVIWVRGFPAPRHLRPGRNEDAILIRELHQAENV